jgi:hypothetical protein
VKHTIKFVKAISLVLILIFFKSAINAQVPASRYNMGKVFDDYIAVKNALADNDGTTAEVKANEMSVLLTSQPDKGLNHEQWKFLASNLEQLIDNSKSIGITSYVDKQRPFFAKLSTTMFIVLKGLKINTSPIYQQYCPMDKLYWLSEATIIKNPYHYTNDMIACGKVVDTL